MDLHIDTLNKKANVWRISLAHNYKSAGDVIADPDMEVTGDFAAETAQAETYQDTYVYTERLSGVVAGQPGRARGQDGGFAVKSVLFVLVGYVIFRIWYLTMD